MQRSTTNTWFHYRMLRIEDFVGYFEKRGLFWEFMILYRNPSNACTSQRIQITLYTVGPCFFFVHSYIRSCLSKDAGMRLLYLLRILTKSLPLQGFISLAQQGCLGCTLHTFPKSHAAFGAQPPTLSRRNKRPDSDDVINDSCIIIATIIFVEFFYFYKNTFATHDRWRIYCE